MGSPLLRLIPMTIALAVVVSFRLVLSRRRQRRKAPRDRTRRRVPVRVLVPVVMIGMAALSGAFSSLGTAVGMAFAPITFGAGVILALALPGQSREPSAAAGSDGANSSSFWIFVVLVTIRMAVIAVSSGAATPSALHALSADLMLVSVGMATIRIATTWRTARAHMAAAVTAGARPDEPSTTPGI